MIDKADTMCLNYQVESFLLWRRVEVVLVEGLYVDQVH